MKPDRNQVTDKKPHYHLAKGVMIGVIAPVVTVALLVKHYHKNKNKNKNKD